MSERSTPDHQPGEPGSRDDGAPARGVSGDGATDMGATDGRDAAGRETEDDASGGPAMDRLRGGSGRSRRTRGEKEGRSARPWYIEIPMLIVIALVLVFLVQTFIGRVYRIPSESMEPTLHGCAGCNGDRIFVDKISYDFTDPRPGDVVVFRGPESWNEGYQSIRSSNPIKRGLETVGAVIGIVPPDENDLVKRVIATGGQTVGGCSPTGQLLVDGAPLDEPYLHDDPAILGNRMNCDFGPVHVPDGNVWVMGDNRNRSADSRYHMQDQYQGTVPEDEIIGKVRSIILPVGRIGLIDSPEIAAR